MKTIPFILLLTIFAGNATAAYIENLDEGVFGFRMDTRAPNYVNYTKISLVFTNYPRTRSFVVIEDQTVTAIGQHFIVDAEDPRFPEAVNWLTNGIPNYIAVLASNPPVYKKVESTEPDLLFGDPSGEEGIDFAGGRIETIKLEITDLHFILGFDQSGPYTLISVQGVVSIAAEFNPLARFAEAYGSTVDDFHYDFSFDADGDGDVDGEDLSVYDSGGGVLQ